MISSIKQVDSSLYCPICLQLCVNAVQSSCCTVLFCQKCSNQVAAKFGQCPYCKKKPFVLKESKIIRKMISSLKVTCPNNCGANVDFGSVQQHINLCPQTPISCKFCLQQMLKKHLSSHIKEKHKEQAYKAILQMHNQQIKQKQKPKQQRNNKFDPQINSANRKAEIGQNGKYYCGGLLVGKCKCCDGHCGPTNGENCDACMMLDCLRWRLNNKHLVNSQGYICLISQNGVFCGRTWKNKGKKNQIIIFGLFKSSNNQVKQKCGFLSQCWACSCVQHSIKIGRYKNLVGFTQ